MPTIDVDDLFVPRHAIRSQKEFLSGRDEFIIDAIEELETSGTSLVLFGERGVGKTSLGWQIYDILCGNHFLLNLWGKSNFKLKNNYECFWIQCEDNMVSIEGALLRSLMKSDLKANFYDKYNYLLSDKKTTEFERKYKIDFKVVGSVFKFLSKQRNGITTKAKELQEKKQSIRLMLSDVISLIRDENPNREIIIFFDEVDRLPIKHGIASLIKETNDARFVILGIGRSQGELIGIGNSISGMAEDHESAFRKLAPIEEVPRLSRSEIRWIFDRAMTVYPEKITFENNFIDDAVKKSQGFPWVAQAIGHTATRTAIKESKKFNFPIKVRLNHLDTSIKKLVRPREQEKAYIVLRKVLLSNQISKINILRILVKAEDRWTHIEEIYDKVPGRQRRFVEDNIKEFVNYNLLLYDDDLVGFRDPIGRLLTELHIESTQI